MAIDYRITARELVKELGGDSNITNVTHCATRLRFILKDESTVNSERVSKIPGVITTVQAGGQYQVVIGNHVKDAFGFVMELVTVDENAAEHSGNKVGIFNRIVDIISSIFAPFLYTLAACGILQGILGIFVALNMIDTAGGTYQILNFISWTAFTFLPVLISITAAKKFGVNTYASVVIACALVCPDYINMVNAGASVHFLGIKVQLLSYTSSVIPIIAGIIVGGLWEVLVIFGVHWGITPVTVGNYAALGYDTFTGLQASAVFSQAGAALGVFLKTKDKEMKGVSASAAITGIFGITEPAIYGVNLRLKKPMICGCIAGAVGGGVAGAFHAVSWGYNMPGIATIPAYFKAGYTSEFIGFLISIAVSFALGVILTYLVGFKENAVDDAAAKEAPAENPSEKKELATPSSSDVIEIASPAAGKVIPVTEVNDEVFASKGMGDGVGIIVEEGKIYAPFDGVVEAVFPTGHAIGLGLEANGVETLIHIGINTVELGGKGYQAHVSQADTVKKGDLLVTFDKGMIEQEGYDTTVIFIVTDMAEDAQLDIKSGCRVDKLEKIMSIRQ